MHERREMRCHSNSFICSSIFGLLVTTGSLIQVAGCDGGSSGTSRRTDDPSDGADNPNDATTHDRVCKEDDDGVLSCVVDVGAATSNAFAPNANNSDGVGDQDGALILRTQTRVASKFIWIANSEEGTVSKFDTTTYEELGRYVTGSRGRNNDPSRTSVNTLGDVYVGNRVGSSVARIAAQSDSCPDTNKDGTVTSSTRGDEVLAWGQDDCVLWHTDLRSYPGAPGTVVRSVSAQDVERPDGTIEQYVWIGAFNERRLYKLDGLTGRILFHVDLPVYPYGSAMDGKGNLWIASKNDLHIAYIDTAKCEAGNCPANLVAQPDNGYGITVDAKQRIWLGGTTIKRYDPATGKMDQIPIRGWSESPAGINIFHGIAADMNGWIWAAGFTSGVVRINADNPSENVIVRDTEGWFNKGMAVDADGKIWSVTQESRAVVITPGPGLNDATVNPEVAKTIVAPYTYSDMTGLQLLLAIGIAQRVPEGSYRRVLRGCGDDPERTTEWKALSWKADTPTGSTITFRFRVADSEAALSSAEWLPLATVPTDTSPASIDDIISSMNLTETSYLELEIGFRAARGSASATPKVDSVRVSYECPRTLR